VRRNSKDRSGRVYRPSLADDYARWRRARSRRNRRFTPEDWATVVAHLRLGWSPEQIAGRFRRAGGLHISHETIYRYVWNDKRRGGTHYKQLRQAGKKRRKRYGAYDSRGRLAGKRHISERPAAVEARTELGHWEIDTMLGKGRPCVATLVERSAGYVMIGQLKARTVTELNNGTEFHGYKQIEEEDRRPILLRHAPPLPGARHLGEHQRPRQAVPAQGTEHAPAHPGRLRPHRPTTQHPPQVAPPLPHTQGGNMIAHASMKRCTSKLIPRRMPFSPGTPLDRSMEVL